MSELTRVVICTAHEVFVYRKMIMPVIQLIAYKFFYQTQLV